MMKTSEDGKKEEIFISGMYPKYYTDSKYFESGKWLSSQTASAYEFTQDTIN